jgi:chemotaxis regulatin CheY-phosphate phosphatase CheZ
MKTTSATINKKQTDTVSVMTQNDEMLTRIGHVTRTLHDSLMGLGFDQI